MSANDNPSRPITIAIATVATLLVLVIGVAVGLSLQTDNAPQRQEMPGASAPSTGSSTDSQSQRSSSSSTSPSTEATEETSRRTPSPTKGTSEKSTTTTESSQSESSSTSAPSTTPTKGIQDFGTGRDDLDGLGFIGTKARCNPGDRAFAVLATEAGTVAAACETRSGDKYYRSDAPSGSLSTEIIVDEGDRIVARNGSYKYQMSPEGLLVTKDNNPIEKQPAASWGTT